MKPKKLKVTSKHQICIPTEIRFFLELEQGDYVVFRREGSKVTFEKAEA